MFEGCLQLMWAHLQVIWVRAPRYLQLRRFPGNDLPDAAPPAKASASGRVPRSLEVELAWYEVPYSEIA